MKSGSLTADKQVRHIIVSFTFFILLAGSPVLKPGECQELISAKTDNAFYMVINRPEGSPLYEWTRLIYEEVFRRLNIEVKFDYYPLKRAGIQTDSGESDGEPARVYSYAENYTNLLRIEEAVFSMTVVAYAADPEIKGLKGWESLRGTEFQIEYPRGMKICELNLPKIVKKEFLHSISGSYQGLARLAEKRTDLYIDDLNSASPIINNPELGLKDKINIAGVMASAPLYMFVHKRHRGKVARLANIIRAIKSEGLVEKYRIEAFGIRRNNSYLR